MLSNVIRIPPEMNQEVRDRSLHVSRLSLYLQTFTIWEMYSPFLIVFLTSIPYSPVQYSSHAIGLIHSKGKKSRRSKSQWKHKLIRISSMLAGLFATVRLTPISSRAVELIFSVFHSETQV